MSYRLKILLPTLFGSPQVLLVQITSSFTPNIEPNASNMRPQWNKSVNYHLCEIMAWIVPTPLASSFRMVGCFSLTGFTWRQEFIGVARRPISSWSVLRWIISAIKLGCCSSPAATLTRIKTSRIGEAQPGPSHVQRILVILHNALDFTTLLSSNSNYMQYLDWYNAQSAAEQTLILPSKLWRQLEINCELHWHCSNTLSSTSFQQQALFNSPIAQTLRLGYKLMAYKDEKVAILSVSWQPQPSLIFS